MKSVRFSTAIVTSLAAAAFLPTIAYAQSDEPEVEQKSHLDVVVVTARKAEENLQETPVAVTAISAKDIEAQQLTFATDIQRAAPGLMSRGRYRSIGNCDICSSWECPEQPKLGD